uniref:Disease resistance R13L4/SHOC-2-like LRR domain-containing protein n=1 Tax=Setaria italica TaxID=4555 RepID=K3XS53_SETIT
YSVPPDARVRYSSSVPLTLAACFRPEVRVGRRTTGARRHFRDVAAGVVCGDDDGYVISLDLGDRGLESSALDHVIFSLTSLRYLDLALNDFNGSQLPKDQGGHSKLYSNHIWYFVGPNIGSLIANLGNLKELYLDRVYLSGNGVKWCGAFLNSSTPELQVLSLRWSNLSGPICGSLSGIRSITEINLELNCINDPTPESVAELPFLRSHVLSNNYLEGCGTSFSGPIPSSISNLKSLKELGLAASDYSQELPSTIGKLKSLRLLEVTGAATVGTIPSWVTNLTSLESLRFSSCGLFGEVPLAIGNLKNLTRLELNGCNFSGMLPPHIFNLTQLEVINLDSNNFIGTIELRSLWNLPHLFILSLSNYKLTVIIDGDDNLSPGTLPRSLVGCKYLEVFDIGNNHISDTFPCWMSMLPELQVLVLIPTSWEKNNCEFIKLRILDLASNKFSGTLQDEWFVTMKSMVRKSANDMMYNQVSQLGQTYHLTDAITYKGNEQVLLSTILSALVHIDVSDNAFHGAIPKSIGHLVLLNGVNMSHNALTGPIPPQFGALKQLESLDLSSNDLSGEIPQELGSLNFLSTLNLSYNELVGRIPDSTHFSTFSNLSFMGNIGLCGLQVSKVRNSTNTIRFGVGFAIAIIWTWGIRVGRGSRDHTFMCWKKVLFFMSMAWAKMPLH